MKTKIEPSQSFNPLISQSFNQESLNQRIAQSTNQPIKKASAPCSAKILHAMVFRASPVAGRMAEQPHTQTKRGGGFIASASGIGRPSCEQQ